MRRDHLNRRSFLRALGIALTTLGTGRTFARAGERADPASPGAVDPLAVDGDLTSSIDVSTTTRAVQSGKYDRIVRGRVDGFVVPRGEVWRVKGLVRSDRNVIVKGTLVMRSGDTLRFTKVDEARFIGSGMDPVASDVGLWVMGRGRLDAIGTTKLGWARATGPLAKGETSLTLDAVPVGWQVGDRIIVTPTTPYIAGGYTHRSNRYWDHFDDTRIKEVNGSTITLATPMVWAHPSCTLPDGRVMTAEVANLTRDVRIEGTTSGRTHIFIRSAVPQTIRHVEMSYLSPLKKGAFIPGRWGLHFHHAMDGSRGSLIEGCSMHDIGGRGAVAHASHGTTWRDVVIHQAKLGEAFWWDEETIRDNSHDTLWDHCLASKTGRSNFRLTGGKRNVVRDSVAVGGVFNTSGGGFLWPGGLPGRRSEFDAIDCVSHNNRGQGLRVWQNGQRPTTIDGFVSYRNQDAGVGGAYGATVTYRRLVLADNATPWAFHALSSSYSECIFDGAGGDYAAETGKHKVVGQDNALTNCHFRNYTTAGLHLNAHPSGKGEKFRLIDCTFEGNEFWVRSDVPSASYVHVSDAAHGEITLHRSDKIETLGVLNPAWNALVTTP